MLNFADYDFRGWTVANAQRRLRLLGIPFTTSPRRLEFYVGNVRLVYERTHAFSSRLAGAKARQDERADEQRV